MWIFAVLLQLAMVFAGIQDARRAGIWSWRGFLLILGFGILECAIVIMPAYYIHDVHNPYFWPVYTVSWIIAIVNLVCMILIVRRWTPVKNVQKS